MERLFEMVSITELFHDSLFPMLENTRDINTSVSHNPLNTQDATTTVCLHCLLNAVMANRVAFSQLNRASIQRPLSLKSGRSDTTITPSPPQHAPSTLRKESCYLGFLHCPHRRTISTEGSTLNPNGFYLEPRRVLLWGQPKNPFGTLFPESVLGGDPSSILILL
jgi:hypothetical protein